MNMCHKWLIKNQLLSYEQIKKHIFLFNYFVDLQKKDFIINLFLLKKTRKLIAKIKFPSSEDIKNFSVKIKKHRKGVILECFYGGGNNLYSRHFYFKCDKDGMYLYKIIGTHTTPNSDKTMTDKKYIQPQIDISDFDIVNYIDNTP